MNNGPKKGGRGVQKNVLHTLKFIINGWGVKLTRRGIKDVEKLLNVGRST